MVGPKKDPKDMKIALVAAIAAVVGALIGATPPYLQYRQQADWS